MTAPPSTVARPYLPTKDLAASTAFYEALGFEKRLETPEVAIFSCGPGGAGGFLLQAYYVQAWAESCVMQLMVEDLAAWWAHIQRLDLPGRFGVAAPRPPAMQPWGLRVAYLFDPVGVLWHVAQVRDGAPQDRP